MIQRLTSLFDHRPQTAEAWLARMRRPDVSARDQAAFLAWLEADENHLSRYEAAKTGLAELSPLSDVFAPDLARLRGRRTVVSQRRLLIAGGLATGAVAAVVAVALVLPGVGQEPAVAAGRDYASAPGQITDVTLEDGSRVTLDSDTRIQVAYGRDARRVTLMQGAAYFDVAHNVERPFQVSVEDRYVIVTGTRFAAALRKDQAEVSLLEGRVAIGRTDVGRARALERAIALAPGQQAVFKRGVNRVSLRRVDVEAATAWRDRRLVFHDAPLSVVAEEVGRYAGAPLVIADPALAQVRVTAVLPLTDEAGLIDRLDALLPISIERAADGRLLVHAD